MANDMIKLKGFIFIFFLDINLTLKGIYAKYQDKYIQHNIKFLYLYLFHNISR